MNIGNIQLKNPFLAAPLAGVTDAPARSLASMMGAALTFSEIIDGCLIIDVYLRCLKSIDKVSGIC